MKQKRSFFSCLCYIFATLLILAAILTTALSFFLKNFENYIKNSLIHIEKQTGYTVTIDRLEWSFARGAGLTIHNLRINDTRHGRFLFSEKETVILIKILPLLKKEIEISRLILHSPQIEVFRKTGNLEELLQNILTRKNMYPLLFNLHSSLNELKLTDGSFALTDDKTGVTETFTGIHMECERTGQYTFTISAGAHYPETATSAAISINTAISALEPSVRTLAAVGTVSADRLPLSRLASFYFPDVSLPLRSKRFSARLDFTLKPGLIYSAHGSVNASQITIPINSKSSVNNAQFDADIAFSSKDTVFSVKKFTLNIPGDIQLRGAGSVSDLFSANPSTSLTIGSNEIQLSSLIPFVQQFQLPSWDNMTATKALSSISRGSLRIENALYRGSFTSDIETILSSCNGTVSLKTVQIPVRSKELLIRIPQAAFSYDKGTATGKCRAQVFGNDNHTIEFTISPVYPKPEITAHIDSTVPGKSALRIIALLSGTIPEAPELISGASGFLYARTTVSRKDRLRISSRIDATNASCTIAGSITKPRRVPAVFSLTGSAPSSAGTPDISFSATIDNALSVSGNAQPATGVWECSYAVNAFRFNRLQFPLLPPPFSISGNVSGRGTFSVPSGSASSWSVNGGLKIPDFSFHKKGKTEPLMQCSLNGDFCGEKMNLDSATMRMGKSEFNGSGTLDTILPPAGSLTAHAPVFDIDDFVETITDMIRTFKKYRTQKKPSHKKNPFFNTDLVIALSADRVNFMSWDFVNGSSVYTYKHAVMRWDDIKATASPDNGTVYGSVLYDFKDHDNKILSLVADHTDVGVLWAIKKLGTKKTLTGRMNLQGEFTSTYEKINEIIPNMDSSFHIRITNGKLQKFTVLAKILSLLDISQLIRLQTPDPFSTGMPFSEIKSDFVMQNSIMSTDNFTLKSPALNLSAVGDINLKKAKLDFTVGVQVFDTIAKIIGTIPYAGEKITGKNKTLTIGYFKVSGPFDSPSVTPQPFETIDSTVMKIFNSVLSIPLDIIDIPFKIYDHIRDVSPTRKEKPDGG